MRDNTIHFIWLQCALGISSSLRTQEILAAFGGSARAIYDASDYDRRIAGVFTNMQLEKLRRTPFAQAQVLAEECAQQKVHILSPQDPTYPAQLREIPNMPLVLYARGSLDFLEAHLPLAIVGTRRADRKSVDIASRLSGELTRAGCAIVSGGALGIDSAAHWGALHANGKTIAVLGCGLLHGYLPENSALRKRIAQTGAVISEYPGDTAPTPRSFPVRNRIISGICAGVVVVEAGERSGSLITATCAAEQGRDVFAVPGDAFGSTYTGGNKLIREGAKPIFSAMDVLEEYEMIYPELLNMRQATRDLERPSVNPEQVPVKRPAKPAQPAGARRMATEGGGKPPALPKNPSATIPPAPPTASLSPLEQAVMECLSSGPLHIDDITKATSATLGELFAAITKLEIEGLVRQSPGKLYELARQCEHENAL